MQRAALADQTRQSLGASPARDQSESRSPMPKNSMWRGDAMMAGEREVEAAAHAVCGYGGVDRGREGFDRGYWSLRSAPSGQIHKPWEHRGQKSRSNPRPQRTIDHFRQAHEWLIFQCHLSDRIGQREHALARNAVGPIIRPKPQNADSRVLVKAKTRPGHRGQEFQTAAG
jgi:hypothetical protein